MGRLAEEDIDDMPGRSCSYSSVLAGHHTLSDEAEASD